jgi:hypothetical protein
LNYDRKIGLQEKDFNTIVSPALSSNLKTSDLTKKVDTKKFNFDANKYSYVNANQTAVNDSGDVPNVPTYYQ